MKSCTKCGIEKDLACFGPRLRNKDGLASWCNTCKKVASLKYARSEQGKANRKEYIQTGQGKSATQTAYRKYREDNPDKIAAQKKLNNAIRDGKLERPEYCERCFAGGDIEAHHWSYLEEHQLAVQWLCQQCHTAEHQIVAVLPQSVCGFGPDSETACGYCTGFNAGAEDINGE